MKTRIVPTQYEHATHMAICPEKFDWEFPGAMKRIPRAIYRPEREHWIALKDRRVWQALKLLVEQEWKAYPYYQQRLGSNQKSDGRFKMMRASIFSTDNHLVGASRQLSKPAMRDYLANTGCDKADIAENE